MKCAALFSTFVLGSLAAAVSGQELRLAGTAGSFPGVLELRLASGPIGKACAIVPSTTSGPTHLALIDPRDPRQLDLGVDLLGFAFAGVFLPPDGVFTMPRLPVPNDPGLRDATLFFQGIDFPGARYLVDRISNPAVARFAASGSWRDRNASVTTDRSLASVLPDGDGGWMIAAGGRGGISAQVPVKTTEIYDALNDRFRAGPIMNVERSLHTATRLRDGRWLLAGGIDVQQAPQTSCEIWDPSTRRFTLSAPLLYKRAGHMASLLPDGRVFVSGGFAERGQPNNQISILLGALAETEIYDPVADRWTRGPDMTVPRIQHAHLDLPGGKILIAAGAGWIRILIKIPALFKDCDLYDPGTNQITTGPAMIDARGGFSRIRLDANRYLIAGGGKLDLQNPGAPTDATEIYDALANRWTSAGKMTQARTLHEAVALGGGRFLHIGGVAGNLQSLDALDSVDIYDANTGLWAAGPKMPIARAGAAVHVTPTGQVQLISGQGPNKLGLLTSVLFYP